MPKFKWEAPVFAESFHTGFRKGCGSDWSVLLWHLITILPENVWMNFCQHMVDGNWSNKYEFSAHAQTWKPTEYRHEDRHLAFVLYTGLKMVDANTWAAIWNWMEHCAETIGAASGSTETG